MIVYGMILAWVYSFYEHKSRVSEFLTPRIIDAKQEKLILDKLRSFDEFPDIISTQELWGWKFMGRKYMLVKQPIANCGRCFVL